VILPALTLCSWVMALIAAAVALAARRLLAERMELVARASHELRGPITAARLGLQLGDPSPQRLRALDLELGRATIALDDLAGVGSRSARDRGREQVDVQQLLADSVEAWRPAAAAEEGVELRDRWLGGSALVLGDRLRLAQATGNLIANAIEHGGGIIEVRGRAEGAEVRLEVIDGGAGLPACAPALIGRAYRPRGPRGRGLAIAQAIARDHGGRLTSAPSDRGARLVLTLPAARLPSEWVQPLDG
jgi:signal transduction histidine kinase